LLKEGKCPKCRKGSDKKGDNPVWDDTEVLEFIVKMYSKEKIVAHTGTLNNTAESDSKKSRADLDWWERMQRENDLKKIKEIRQMKKRGLEDLQESGQHLPASNSNSKKIKFKARDLYSTGISRGDMNMCVMFYGLCLGIIALLYYHFVMRKKMNPCNSCKNSKEHI